MNKELKSNTREINRLKVNDVNLSSNAKDLPLGHENSKVIESDFLDNELKSTERNSSKEGHN